MDNAYARTNAQPIDIGILRGMQNTNAPKSEEPSILAKARYALGHINEAMHQLGNIDQAISGGEITGPDNPPAMHLDATLTMVSERAAMLLGRLRTIKGLIGDVSDPRTPPRAA